MRVVLFTTGITDIKTTKNLVRKYIPEIISKIKTISLLLPPGMQRPLLSGFSRERRFPTGLGLLSAMLKKAGHEVFLVDRFVDPDDWIDDLQNVDFVGIHTTTPCFADALAIVDPTIFGITMVDKDGNIYEVGDTKKVVSICTYKCITTKSNCD